MSEANSNQEIKTTRRSKLHRKLDVVGCALFFIWIGISILANLGWGVWLIGVGVIILGGLAAKESLSDTAGSRATKTCC
ncbi:MAG: hypothetical protein WCO53_08085 [Deltaproteobacteria bacterium]